MSSCLAEDAASESEEAAGVVNAWVANSYGLDSYEIYIESWQSGEKPDGTIHERKEISVVGAEHLPQRYSVFGRIDSMDDGVTSTCVASSCIVADKGYSLACNGTLTTFSEPHLIVREHVRIPDVRLLGHRRFPGRYGKYELTQ